MTDFEMNWADILPLDLDKIPPKAKDLWKENIYEPQYEGTNTKYEPVVYAGNWNNVYYFIVVSETNEKKHLLKMTLWRNDNGVVERKSVKIL